MSLVLAQESYIDGYFIDGTASWTELQSRTQKALVESQ